MDLISDYVKYFEVLEKCLTSINTTSYPSDGGIYCNATWDSWQCWNFRKAGDTSYQSCPDYIMMSNPSESSSKTCTQDGTWFVNQISNKTWTNYTMCFDYDSLEKSRREVRVYFYGFAISIVLLVISLIIFSIFSQLKCVRVTLHKHLFVPYIFTGALWITYYATVPEDKDVLSQYPLWCQVLHVFTNYFTVCNYAWMFCEGFYLHALIVIAFTKDKTLIIVCYFVGWVFPILPSITYTVARAFSEDENKRCWTGDSNLHWILAVPINAMLIVNFIFAVNIMRILLSKLRSDNSNEMIQSRRLVRAFLILIPLLGLQNILFPFRPTAGSDGEHVYSIIIACSVSFQGAVVALVLCFFNGEVVKLFKMKIHRFRMIRSKKCLGSKTGSSFKRNGDTRSTMRTVTDINLPLQPLTTNNDVI